LRNWGLVSFFAASAQKALGGVGTFYRFSFSVMDTRAGSERRFGGLKTASTRQPDSCKTIHSKYLSEGVAKDLPRL